MKNFDDKIPELIRKHLSGEATREELQFLLKWLKADAGHVVFFNQTCLAWENSADFSLKGYETELALSRLNKRILQYQNKPAKSIPVIRFGRVAAVMLMLVASSFFLYFFLVNNKKDNEMVQMFEAIAPPSQKSQIILSDGTKVWLNSGTVLKYSPDYGKQTRDVFLQGEAYFEVAKNPHKPFQVHASKLVIKALGTSFNVKCYDNEKTIETTLVEGSVKIFKNASAISRKYTPIILKPNEKAVFVKENEHMEVAILEKEKFVASSRTMSIPDLPSIEAVISWKNEELIFENETFEEMAMKLERWYNVKFILSDQTMKTERYSGAFTNDESLDKVLEIISKATPIRYEIKNKTVKIMPGR